MGQVGHADSRTTLQIYAKVLRRRDRKAHGEAVDELVGQSVPSDSTGEIVPIEPSAADLQVPAE